MDHVAWIYDQSVAVDCAEPARLAALLELGARRSERGDYELAYEDDAALAALLAALRDLGLPMQGGAGWPPAAVFRLLRQRGLLAGTFVELLFRGPGELELTPGQ